MTNSGAHGLDQSNGPQRQPTGPVEIWTVTPGPNGKVSLRYADGTLVRLELDRGPQGGAIFVGKRGKMEINRNKFTTNPPDLVANPPPPAVAEPGKGRAGSPGRTCRTGSTASRPRKAQCEVKIGHRSISVCHLANIAREVGRRLHWDPRRIFPGDDEANRYLNRPRRKGYELPA